MRYFFIIIFLLGCLFANAQATNTKNDSIPYELSRQGFIYSAAKSYNDPIIARVALYNILAYNPRNTPVLDSLAKIYYEYQQYASAALVAQDAIKLNPDDIFAIEIAAASFDNLGVKIRAIANYEKLYLAENDMTILYKIAFLQYESKRYGESINNINTIFESSDADKLQLIFPTDSGQNQAISLKAATNRLYAMLEQDRGNNDNAKNLYKKAIEMEPNFELAKKQLAEIK